VKEENLSDRLIDLAIGKDRRPIGLIRPMHIADQWGNYVLGLCAIYFTSWLFFII